MNRRNARPDAPQVLKGLRVTTLARGLPYHEPAEQGLAQSLAAKPAAVQVAAAMDTAPASALPTPSVAQATTAEMQEQIAAALADAERAGYQQGLANGRKEAQRELARDREALEEQAKAQEAARQASVDAAIVAVEQALRTLDDQQRRHRELVAAQAAGLAFEALCRVVGRASAARETLLPLIEAALDRWAGAPLPRLRLSPDDLAALKATVPEERMQSLLARVEAVADRAVPPMGALVEDGDGGLDIGLDTQLRALGEAWTHALAAREDTA